MSKYAEGSIINAGFIHSHAATFHVLHLIS